MDKKRERTVVMLKSERDFPGALGNPFREECAQD